MPDKPNLLIVGDYNRDDFINLFQVCKNDFYFYFLEYASINEVHNKGYLEFGKAIFWKDYFSAYDLLDKVKPKVVIFYFIESYNHVALNVACKVRGIKTFHLEHGFRDYNLTKFVVEQLRKGQISQSSINEVNNKRGLIDLVIKIRTQLFYFLTILRSPLYVAKFLIYYYKIRRSHLIFDTFKIVKSPLRLADAYISFSPAIFKVHKIFDHLNDDQKVFFIGFPNLHRFVNIEYENGPISKNVIFIDQPFVKQGLLGWDKEYQNTFIDLVFNAIKNSGYELFVKKHPVDDVNMWDELAKLDKIKLIEDDGELSELLIHPSIILGFYSTLLLPLAALPNTTLFTLETHPVKGVFPSEFLVKSGVGVPVFEINELRKFLDSAEKIRQIQKTHKQKFVEDWLYKFDDGALQRLKDILLA